MKIYTFTTVKDEEDIIESFVRYHLNIVDGMVISDNCSNDNTLSILKNLKSEGLNIDILEDKSQYFNQDKKRKELFDYTLKKHNPDFIFPIDADEFISCNKDNPRKIIKKLDSNYLYKYKMINYVLDDSDNKNELFIPKKITCQRRDGSDEKGTYKCFLPKKICEKEIFLFTGCHDACYLDESKIPTITLEDLFLAHYPVRNKKQLMNKVITGRLNNSSIHKRKENFGFHQYEILDEIINNGTISKKTLYKISKNYGLKDKNDISIIKNKPINCSFCKNIDIKYYNPYNSNVLSNTIKISETVINHIRDLMEQEQEKNIILEKNYNELNKSYNDIVNSKRWKLMNKISNIFKFKK